MSDVPERIYIPNSEFAYYLNGDKINVFIVEDSEDDGEESEVEYVRADTLDDPLRKYIPYWKSDVDIALQKAYNTCYDFGVETGKELAQEREASDDDDTG